VKWIAILLYVMILGIEHSVADTTADSVQQNLAEAIYKAQGFRSDSIHRQKSFSINDGEITIYVDIKSKDEYGLWLKSRKMSDLMFMSASMEKINNVRCDISASLELMYRGSKTGFINVAICSGNEVPAQKSHHLKQKTYLDEVRVLLGGDTDLSKLKKALSTQFSFSMLQLEEGKLRYDYDVVVIGHGIGIVNTMVLLDENKQRSLVVQYHSEKQKCQSFDHLRSCAEKNRFLELLMNTMIAELYD